LLNERFAHALHATPHHPHLAELAEGAVTSKTRIVNFFTSFTMLAICKTLAIILQAVPLAFRVLSRGAAWTPAKSKTTADTKTPARVVEDLISLLTTMGDITPEGEDGDVRGDGVALLEQVKVFLDRQVDYLVAEHAARGAAADGGGGGAGGRKRRRPDPTSPAAYRASLEQNAAEALREARTFLIASSRAVSACAALPKLQAVLKRLRLRDHFSLNAVPPALLDTPNAELQAIMGVRGLHAFGEAAKFRQQWSAHREGLVLGLQQRDGKPPASVSDTEAYKYYAGIASEAPLLATAGRRALTVPVSSASCERVFSLLTHLDTPSRRSMSADTLRHLLLLRANSHVARRLLAEQAAAVGVARNAAALTGPEGARLRAQQAQASTQAAAIAQQLARTIAAASDAQESQLE
jgi:hypothetical protein